MPRAFVLSLSMVVLTVGAVAFGQGAAGWVTGGYSPYGYYGGGHASTAAEGYANGLGNVIQSAGQYNLQTSQANINNQQADSMYLDNRVKGTQAYFEMRKMNTDYRKAEATPGLSTEDSWRYAQAALPKRLTSAQLDPVSGKIYWPTVMFDPRYDAYRKQLDQLFRQRETAHGGVGYQTYSEIQSVSDQLKNALNKNINDYKPMDFIKMKNFVDSLAYEAQFPAV